MTVTKEQLLAARPVDVATETIDGLGEIRIRQLTMSQSAKFDLWQKPGGKADKKRQSNRNLKLVTMCLVDDADNPLFDFPDTEEGNRQFFEFVESIGESAASLWDEIVLSVMKHNGWLKEESDLLGK